MDWQPIETAPKDGTLVLVFEASQGVAVACQNGETWYLDVPWNAPDLSQDFSMYYAPTHWMPLPPPPTSPS